MLKEFREFAVKGNMIDLAIGVVLGAAFSSVVNSIVSDLFNPVLGLITNGLDLSNSFVVLRAGSVPPPYASLEKAKEFGAVTLNWGHVVTVLINFLLVALALFFVVKAMNRLRRHEEEKPAPVPEPSAEEVLLTEIRDLLAKKA